MFTAVDPASIRPLHVVEPSWGPKQLRTLTLFYLNLLKFEMLPSKRGVGKVSHAHGIGYHTSDGYSTCIDLCSLTGVVAWPGATGGVFVFVGHIGF